MYYYCLQDDNLLFNYSGKDICNGKFVYPEFPLGNQKFLKVVVAEIYNPSSFYIHMESQVETLGIFMNNLQLVYFFIYLLLNSYTCRFIL